MFYYDPSGKLKSLLTNMTDVVSKTPSIASPPAGQRFEWTTFWNSDTFSVGANTLAWEGRMCKAHSAACEVIWFNAGHHGGVPEQQYFTFLPMLCNRFFLFNTRISPTEALQSSRFNTSDN